MSDTILAVTERSGVVEEYHQGAVAVAGPGGEMVAGAGDVDRPFFVRSSAKPFQALACVEAGLVVGPTQLAVACGSHSGDPIHVAIVSQILAGAGVGESDLLCPPARPHLAADRRLAASGLTDPDPRFHNCSGKHAAMLAACVAAGWDTKTYLDADHPLQRRVGAVIAETTGDDLGSPGVDGCGAPVWTVTTRSLARAFSRLANLARLASVRSAMSRYPMLVSGEGRADGLIGRWLGAPAKGGAAGCIGVAAGGHGIAAKTWSGSAVVAGVGACVGLEWLGLLTASVREGLADVIQPPLTGGGIVVGRISAATGLEKP